MQEILALLVSLLLLVIIVRVVTYSRVLIVLVGLPVSVLVFTMLIKV